MNSSNFGLWIRCVAAANLSLLRMWVELLAYTPWPSHRDYGPPESSRFISTILLCLLNGTLLWAVFRKGARWMKLAACAGIAAICLKAWILAGRNLGYPLPMILAPWLVIAAVFAYLRQVRKMPVPDLVWVAGSILTPFAALTLSQGLWQAWIRPAVAEPIPRIAVRSSSTQAQPRRMVWILFDELDDTVAFTKRPPGVRMPALDRFRADAAFVAKNARVRFNATSQSVPSLLSGHAEVTPDKLDRTVLEALAKRGVPVAVAGWAVPYCPELKNTGIECTWWPMAQQHNSYGRPFDLWNRIRSIAETNHVSPFGQSLSVQHHVAQAEEITQAAVIAASRPDLALVFLHLPQSHNPFVWDPRTHTPSLAAQPWDPSGYLRNLEWADTAFARIRKGMEDSGVWDKSTVLVTADHGYRRKEEIGFPKDDLHVPFLWKTPAAEDLPEGLGQAGAATFEAIGTAPIVEQYLAPSAKH